MDVDWQMVNDAKSTTGEDWLYVITCNIAKTSRVCNNGRVVCITNVGIVVTCSLV